MPQSHTNTYRIYTRSHKVKVDFKDFSEPGHIRVGILVYKLKGIVRKPKFSDQFKTMQKKDGYNRNILRQSACLVINPNEIDSYSSFFDCRTVGQASD